MARRNTRGRAKAFCGIYFFHGFQNVIPAVNQLFWIFCVAVAVPFFQDGFRSSILWMRKTRLDNSSAHGCTCETLATSTFLFLPPLYCLCQLPADQRWEVTCNQFHAGSCLLLTSSSFYSCPAKYLCYYLPLTKLLITKFCSYNYIVI